MTKPRETVTFALAGALIVGVIGLILTAGQLFRIFRFWGLIWWVSGQAFCIG
jgi:hypothetical protein